MAVTRKKATAKRPAAKKATAKKSSPAKKAPAKKTAAKKTTAKKTAPRKAPAKKTAAKKATTKKAAPSAPRTVKPKGVDKAVADQWYIVIRLYKWNTAKDELIEMTQDSVVKKYKDQAAAEKSFEEHLIFDPNPFPKRTAVKAVAYVIQREGNKWGKPMSTFQMNRTTTPAKWTVNHKGQSVTYTVGDEDFKPEKKKTMIRRRKTAKR